MKGFIACLMMAFVLLVPFGCKHTDTEVSFSEIDTKTDATLSTGEAQTDKARERQKVIYLNKNAYSEKYALLYPNALSIFTVESGKSMKYCFDPGCEHIRPVRDDLTGELLTKFCMAYDLGGKAFCLRDDCSYFCSFPILYRADKEGANRRIVAELDFGLPFCNEELYTEDSYFRLYTCNEELIKVIDADTGEERWAFGKQLDKRKVGIFRIGLENGKIEEIFSADDLYDLSVLNLAEYNDHLYFTCIGLDIPFDQLPNITEDWEAYVQAQKEHDFTRVYDYDIANSKLNLIISEQGVGGYDFVDGFIVKPSEEDEPGVLFDLEGDRIRDLPFSPKRLVRSDRYIFAQNYSNGHYMYYLYDPAEDKMLQTVELSNGSFYLLAAVGDSYYGISDNKYWYISAENFWNGKVDQMICMVSE